jgi:hypothetical protein
MRNHRAIISYLSRNCLNCQSGITDHIRFIAAGGFPAGGQYFRSHVAAGFDPLVVLLGEHRADEADDGVAVREDADDVGRRLISLLSRSCGLLDQICQRPTPARRSPPGCATAGPSLVTATPRISRCPSAFTAVAIRARCRGRPGRCGPRW